MRILIITSSTNRSGGTRQALYQAKGLADRGHAVSLCLPADSSCWEFQPEPYWRRLPENKRRWRAALETLLPANPDEPTIVHAFHNKAVKLVAWWGLFWRRRNLACVAHRGVLFRPNNPLPYLSPAMKAFIVNSQACAKAISLYAPQGKIRVVANAVPDERITPQADPMALRRSLGLDDAAPCFIYIGNNTPLKGAGLLLRAFAAARLPQAGLILIGTDPARWQGLTEELGLTGRARHVGHVENVADYLQLGDAFVFPTGLDSSPNTLLEAMRMGLPVVATDVGGVPEIVNGNGILVRPGDAAALSRALTDMAAPSEQRAAWSRASRELGRKYTVNARCQALETIYASLARVP
ncbi:MAG: glycosyltransferase family 4 protein [Deltaproteobacteria bacterium]|jgi:glycosyltransferase involved in cell wall biosynthesis|nr:glycosyltransferase family 4 protein [Deltaproteobacteria bacterium]